MAGGINEIYEMVFPLEIGRSWWLDSDALLSLQLHDTNVSDFGEFTEI